MAEDDFLSFFPRNGYKERKAPKDEDGLSLSTVSTYYAHLYYKNLEQTQVAFAKLNNKPIEISSDNKRKKKKEDKKGVRVYMSYISPINTVYVRGVLRDIVDPSTALHKVFSAYGDVIRIEEEFSGDCRAFYITFKTVVAAIKAVRQLHFTEVKALSGNKMLEVAFDNREDRGFPALPSPLCFPDAYVSDGQRKL